jgi:hypothetical protein
MRRPTTVTFAGAACAALALGLLVPGCASEADPLPFVPACVESRLSEGTAYRYDPPTAIALSHAIAASHPQLAGIVNAVAEYQQQAPHPEPETILSVDYDDSFAEGTMIYMLTIVDLASRPDLATPEVIALFEEIAAKPPTQHGFPGGLGGVAARARDTLWLFETNVPGAVELSMLIHDQMQGVRDAGVLSLPSGLCLAAGQTDPPTR